MQHPAFLCMAGWSGALEKFTFPCWRRRARGLALACVVGVFAVVPGGRAADRGEDNVLAVDIVGRGRVSPNYDGVALNVGQSYTLRATAAKGWRFSHWADDEGPLSLDARKFTFIMQSNYTLQALFGDVQRPVVSFKVPRRGQRWSNELFTVQGTARDNDQVTQVWCRVNDGAWQAAVTTNGWSNWTAQVQLTPGANTVQAYAEDAFSLLSRTNLARVTFIPHFTLRDYFPERVGLSWRYSGTDWDGFPATITQEIGSTNFMITNFLGRAHPVPYVTNVMRIDSAYVDPDSGFPYDTWEEFLAAGPRFGWFGDDDLPKESLRVVPGAVLPERMPVGGIAVTKTVAYMFGEYAGRVTLTAQVLDHGALTVPAGTFPDVLHLRIRIRTAGGTQVFDEWWAHSVGKIKRAAVSGRGGGQAYELTAWSTP